MSMSSSTLPLAGRVVLLLALCGCSQSDWGTLEGVVLVNGAPAGPGTIMLEPVNRTGPGAMASFGADGVYSIVSAGRKPGAPVGEYRVTIVDGEGLGEEAGPRPKSVIPVRYSRADASNLTVTIESGDNTKNFELEP